MMKTLELKEDFVTRPSYIRLLKGTKVVLVEKERYTNIIQAFGCMWFRVPSTIVK